MRRPIFLILINAMILLVIFALLTQSLVIVQRLAVADSVLGRIEVQRSGRGDFRALSERDFVKTGDIVRANANSEAEFVWADGTRWKLMPNTQLRIQKASSNLLQRADNSQLALERGKVFIRVAKRVKAGSQFGITTPQARINVTGTVFSLEIQAGKTCVAVDQGTVRVQSQNDANAAQSIGAAQYAMVGSAIQVRATDQTLRDSFRAQPSIIKPQLDARLQTNDDGSFLISGQTESDDRVTINGQSVRTIGNGVFRRKMARPTSGQFIVITRDIHGASRVQTLLVPLQ